jgi:hypothetical protein
MHACTLTAAVAAAGEILIGRHGQFGVFWFMLRQSRSATHCKANRTLAMCTMLWFCVPHPAATMVAAGIMLMLQPIEVTKSFMWKPCTAKGKGDL